MKVTLVKGYLSWRMKTVTPNSLDRYALGVSHLIDPCCLEAARLTSFMMNYVRILSSGGNDSISTWDMSICSLDEDSFHIATWRLLCENIDIWSSHASKKDLKNFFSNLIKFSFVQKRSCRDEESGDCQDSCREITLHTISVELLCDTIIYDQKVSLSYSFHPKLCSRIYCVC